jgi:hypothetical protein
MQQVKDSIELYELNKMAGGPLHDVKGAVDAWTGHMVVDLQAHADGIEFLALLGSNADDIWGFTLFPEKFGTPEFILFDAEINVRPSRQNRSRTIEDEKLRTKLIALITQKVRAKVSPY